MANLRRTQYLHTQARDMTDRRPTSEAAQRYEDWYSSTRGRWIAEIEYALMM